MHWIGARSQTRACSAAPMAGGGRRARLELGDGADKGLLGALEQLREPAAQAAVALRGGGMESRRCFREGEMGIRKEEGV